MYRKFLYVLILLAFNSLIFADKVAIKKKDTPIYKTPKMKKVLKKANFGQFFEVVKEGPNYYLIKLEDRKAGYIKKEDAILMKTVKTQNTANPQATTQLTTQATTTQSTNNYSAVSTNKKVVKDKKWREKNAELMEYEITKVKHVKKLLKYAKEGYDGAIVALEKALLNRDDEVREAALNALVEIGPAVIPIIGPKIKSRLYIEKKQIVEIFKRIADPAAVPYLQMGLIDKSIRDDVAEALRVIPGPEAKRALQRIEQTSLMQAKIDSIKRAKEEKYKRIFAKYDLEYKDLKTNILTLAWELAQYKKTPPKDAIEQNRARELRELFNEFIKEYDSNLGEGASIKMLKDNGYDESILSP